MKGIYTKDRFTDEELLIIDKVAKVICHVFNITEEELRGTSRKKPFPDARKVLCHYICNNIKLEKVHGSYNVALPTWYLKQNHTTVSYAVKLANDLYACDKNFRVMYDNVIGILNNPEEYKLIVLDVEDNNKKLTWDDVKYNPGYSNEIKDRLIPKKIADRIKEMYHLGYSLKQIAYDTRVSINYLSHYVKRKNFDRGFIKATVSRKDISSIAVKIKQYSTVIDY